MLSEDILNILPLNKHQLSSLNSDDSLYCLVYDANRIVTSSLDKLAQAFLSERELNLQLQRKKISAQKEFLASRFIIKKLITQLSNHTYDEIEVEFDEANVELKSYIGRIALPFKISISHSKGVVLVVLSTRTKNIGADIEYMSEDRNFLKLAQQFFHPSEVNLIEQKGAKIFYELWTMKEALAKLEKKSVTDLLRINIRKNTKACSKLIGLYDKFALTIFSSVPNESFTLTELSIVEFEK